jgi:hypothetical protein
MGTTHRDSHRRRWVRILGVATAAWFVLAGTPVWAAQLSLSWKDNAGNENGFVVERRTNPSGSYAAIATLGVNAVGYIDTTVTVGQGYCYRVRAFNEAGSSGYTNQACGTVSASPPPPSPNPARFSVTNTTASPDTVARGQGFTVTTTVTNTGGQSVSAAIVNIEIKNAQGATVLQDFVVGQTFAAGQSRSRSFALTLPETIPAGIYYTDVAVFSGDWTTMYVYEWHAGTFTVTTGTVPPGQPTFSVNSASATPDPVTRGQWVAVSTAVTNTSGNQASGIILDVEIKDGTGMRITQQLAVGQVFSPGQTRQLNLSLEIPTTIPAGTYHVDVALFNAVWSAMYVYEWHATSFVVR